MNADKIHRLEKNEKFKRKFYSKDIWKNYAIVPPSLIIFVALFGSIYLFNLDLLVSLYIIPFVVLLVLGTVWLKATRKYLINQKISENQTFVICLVIPLMKKDGKTIMIFSTKNNRLNKYYLEKEKKEILERFNDDPNYLDFESSRKILQMIADTEVIAIYPSFLDRILNKSGDLSVNKYIVFDNSEKIRYIASRQLESFS